MDLILAAGSTSPLGPLGSPALQTILLFVLLFAGLNWFEKGRWD